MRLTTYNKISELKRKIINIIYANCNPGERIFSEIKLAEMLNETQNRVHRAILMLTEEGILRSSGGRRGVFLISKIPVFPKENNRKTTLKFNLPLDQKTLQFRTWARVCEMFRIINPEVEFEFINDANTEADIHLVWTPLSKYDSLAELDKYHFEREFDFLPGILKAGKRNGKRYALPVLHSPAVYWGHRNLLARNKLYIEDFRHPLDYFIWGNKLADLKEIAAGFSFYGFTYHSTLWGVEVKNKNGYFMIDRRKLEKFLIGVKDIINSDALPFMPNNNFDYFHRGQVGLTAAYLHTLPINEYRFRMIGQPVLPEGFSNQAVFMLAAGKNTRNIDYAIDFMRFILQEHVQKIFAYPEVKFSVISKVYQEQYPQLRDETHADIPPFDYRGFHPELGMDFHLIAGTVYYTGFANFLRNFSGLRQTVERMHKINISQMRKDFLKELSEEYYAYYINLLN